MKVIGLLCALVLTAIQNAGLLAEDRADSLAILRKPDSPSASWRARQDLFDNATDDEVSDFLCDKADNVSLRAAWIRFTRIAERAGDGSTFDISAAEQRFIGFMEGRTDLCVPTWWDDVLTHGHRVNGEQWFFPKPTTTAYKDTDQLVFQDLGRCFIEFNVLDTVTISSGMSTITIPQDRYKQAKSKGPADSLVAITRDSECYVAIYGNAPVPFGVSCIGSGTGLEKWYSDVWADGGGVSYSGRGYHYVHLVLRGERVYVFGTGMHCIYCECFRRQDGESVFRFGSGY